ncbi:hypothetical protein Tco_1049374 [Tanacetum coccineum]
MVGLVRLTKLAKAANSTMLQDHMLMYINRSVAADVKLTKASKCIFYDLTQAGYGEVNGPDDYGYETQFRTCEKVEFLAKLRGS